MAIEILNVTSGSIASQAGIQAGDILLQINGEDIIDDIDYQALTQGIKLSLTLRNKQNEVRQVSVIKKSYEPLGLTLDEREILTPRECANHCIFCFVDQLPPGMRKTLYVRDDDWRLSLMMGNFVTLTNVGDREFDRILRRKVSPLYISVHATDPEVRVQMLRNARAGNIMNRLRAMKDHGLKFHCQVVCCPGINDGSVLHQTIVDLAGLYPAAQSLAIVPVGLTAHRGHLPNLRLFDEDSARTVLRDIHLIQDYYLKTLGTRFVYASDEFYTIAHLPVPSDEAYEDYPQLENGVGMLRQMIQECEDYWEELKKQISQNPLPSRKLLIPTGVSAFSFIQELVNKYGPRNSEIVVIPVQNSYFGETVTVTGLIVGKDLLNALQGYEADKVLISESMLRENTDSFLDDKTLSEVSEELGIPVQVVENHGESFLRALYGLEDGQ